MSDRKKTRSDSPVVVWFRQDLRVEDNPALAEAAATGAPVIPVFVLDDVSPAQLDGHEDWSTGGASRWWLHHSLDHLSTSMKQLGSKLVLRTGDAAHVIPEIVSETGAGAVFWNRCYEPWAIARDTRIKSALQEDGIEVHSFKGSLLVEPWELKTGGGKPYRVFTPFWKSMLKTGVDASPIPAPAKLTTFRKRLGSEKLAQMKLRPMKPDWSKAFGGMWTPGEAGAHARLGWFLDDVLGDYNEGRDIPGEDKTSGLSAHLHWGDISPRTIWRVTMARAGRSPKRKDDAMAFLREIAWREFSYNLLYHEPALPHANLKSQFDNFPWLEDEQGLAAWQKGLTGYPIVDAGMRQLWETGWMHNRVRMIAASFLIKDLLIHWSHGERWFWDTLVDADLSSNAASWQWVAGSGADAAPYFRVFNPVTQGQKFDAEGDYVRRWVPEVARLPKKYVHNPWEAPPEVLAEAGVSLGDSYPEPIVEHSMARMRALAGYEKIKQPPQ